MNNYHRYLNLPFEVSPPFLFQNCGTQIEHHYINDFPSPQMDEFFRSLGLRCHLKECFYTAPHSKIPIHTDAAEYTNHIKINITWGPKEGVMQWWKSDIVTEQQFTGGEYTKEKHHNLWAKEEDCTFLYEANTNRPSLVNVGVLHGTYNPSNQGRWTLCFLPEKISTSTKKNIYDSYIKWDEALEIFKNYIED